MKKILLDVRKETGHYNSYSKQLHLEYAYGYAVSDAYSECCSMKILLEQADRNMYKCKAEMKEHHKNSHEEKSKQHSLPPFHELDGGFFVCYSFS